MTDFEALLKLRLENTRKSLLFEMYSFNEEQRQRFLDEVKQMCDRLKDKPVRAKRKTRHG